MAMAMAIHTLHRISSSLYRIFSKKRNLSRVAGSDRPWLSDPNNPLIKWDWPPKLPHDQTLTPKPPIADGRKQFTEDEEESILATISRIVRENGDDMESALDNSGVKIYPQLMEKLLERAEYSWKPMLSCFSWAANQSGFMHTTNSFNLMINMMTKMREFDSAWVLVGHMREQGLITSQTFAILMRRYARAGMPEAAVRTFDLMDYFGCKADSDAFHILLDALCKEDKAHPATVFFEQRKSGFESTPVTYNILINGWCRLRRVAKAHKLFDQMVGDRILPSVVSYTTLIDGYCRAGSLEDALKLLGTMKEKGCQPNVITYNSIVDALGEAGKPQDALSMLDEMNATGCTPNISTYNSLVKGLCKQEDLPGASAILKLMMERGCLPTVTTYSYFFRFFCKYGKIKEGMNLYMKMAESGYVPDRLIYQLLIKMLCERGRVELALQVKKEMDAGGCDPDLATCTMLIHRLCRSKRLEEACEHFEKMIQKGISPQYVTYEILMDGLRKANQPDRAQILSEMMVATPHYKRLPNKYKRDDNDDEKQEITDTILNKAQEISQRLIAGKNSKQLIGAGDHKTCEDHQENIVKTARQFIKVIKARAQFIQT